jgi:hypothetical protein
MRLFCVLIACAVSLSACGSSSNSPTTPTVITLLDTTVALVAGQNCNIGGKSVDFQGTANTHVTVALTGSGSTGGVGMNLGVTLYAPDFATQLTGGTGLNTVTVDKALTQTGTHHVSFCEVNGVAGNVRVVVTQN